MNKPIKREVIHDRINNIKWELHTDPNDKTKITHALALFPENCTVIVRTVDNTSFLWEGSYFYKDGSHDSMGFTLNKSTLDMALKYFTKIVLDKRHLAKTLDLYSEEKKSKLRYLKPVGKR